MNNENAIDFVFLQTNLFGKTSDVLEAVSSIDDISKEIVDLQPEKMQDADWDTVVKLVLQAEKVVTV